MRVDLLKRFIFSSPKKQFNLLLVFLSYFLKIKKPWGIPIRLMIEPTNFCNLKCPTCPVGTGEIEKDKGVMSLNDLKKIIDEAGDYLYHITLWNWGEPFLNTKLVEMISYAKKKNIYVITSTNGHFLNKENIEKLVESSLDEIIIALDGLSQETLSRYRVGADFEKIKQGINNLVEYKKIKNKKNPIVQLQFIAMKHNEHEINELKDFASSLGVDKVILKTFGSHLDVSKLKQFEPEDKKISRYNVKNKNKNICKNIWLGMNINFDGNIVPCCYDPFEKHVLGNIFLEDNIVKVWRGNKFSDFRRSVLINKNNIDICKNCDYNNKLSKEINFK